MQELSNAILIVKGATSQVFRKSLQMYVSYHFEMFMQEELLVNITHHELVPKHVILSDSEKAELLKR